MVDREFESDGSNGLTRRHAIYLSPALSRSRSVRRSFEDFVITAIAATHTYHAVHIFVSGPDQETIAMLIDKLSGTTPVDIDLVAGVF